MTKITRRALLMSVMSLFLCFAMLVGTTFAWFTDSVTSGNNIIKTGTLDVAMSWKDGKTDPSDATGWTDASTGAIFDYDLWEPGYVEVRHIKIENKGTLALKYMVKVVANGDVTDLADVIDVYYVDPAVQVADRTALTEDAKLGTLAEALAGLGATGAGVLEAGKSDVITIALKMREDAGNEYQDKGIGTSFAIQLIATQVESESDAFGTDYDEDAEYPEINLGNTQKEEGSEASVKAEEVEITVPDNAPVGNYDLVVSDKEVKTDDQGNTTISMDIDLKCNGAKVDENYNYTVSVNVGAGLNITKLMHGAEEITSFDYNVATGVVTFTTNSFSPFTFVCEKVEATTVTSADELKAAVANGGVITLANDITLSDILVLSKPVVLDGNGKTITSSAARAINVSGVDGVVIKNLTIVASGERAINVIQNATNVTVENVTATAYNYTVNVATSAPDAVVAIKNSTLTGLCTLNVAAPGAVVTVDGGKIVCDDQNDTLGEAYAAVSVNYVATGATVSVTGCEIVVAEGSDSLVAKNHAEGAKVTIDGSSEAVAHAVAIIDYGINYYSFETLESAVDFAKAGETVKLINDVVLTETLVIPANKTVTIDLNGKTISGKNTNTAVHNFLIDVKGGELTMKNGTVTYEHTGTNMGWNGATTVIDVTAGGVLNLDSVTVRNLGGTDMNFAVHLNNWGEVTLNADNCVFDAPYCAVRVFNSGPNMNNVTIKNSKMTGATRAFWVHNYAASDMGGKVYSGSSVAYDKAAVDARLNFDIFDNNNTYEVTGTPKSPIRYGFNETVYFDANGNEVQ